MRSYVKIYQIILIITHNVFNLLCAFYDLYVRARESLSLIFSHEVRWKDAECMDNLFKRLNKTPQHLTVILGTEEPNFGDLINLIVWCTASGIPFVSFYDHNGALKAKEDEFYRTVNAVSGLRKSDGYWKKEEAPFNGYKNGFTRKVRIAVLDLEDGQKRIVDAAKQLLTSSRSDELNVDYLDNYLRNGNGDMPDPDLAIYCGKLCSTYGYMPWQLRVTEFINLKTHHGVTLRDFYDILKAYGECEQRCGK